MELEPGLKIDNLEIIEELGTGGVARVYLARDLTTGQELALKRPQGDILGRPSIYYHFQNEERLLQGLEHPGLISLLDRPRSLQYLPLGLLRGRELRSVFGSGNPLDPETALGIMRDLAEILVYLHQHGLIHLDLKPENLILTPTGGLKLFDFGVGRDLSRSDLLALDFVIPHGTPFYISPEQLEGCRNDPRSDIYAAGLLYYEMLTGRLPFERSTRMAKVRERLKVEPIPPRRFLPDLDPKIQEIIMRCLARDPGDRYPTSLELARDLADPDRVAVTELGLKTDKPSFLARWKPVFKSPSCPLLEALKTEPPKPRVLAAVADHKTAGPVFEAALEEALARNGRVTVLTVIEDDDDSDLIRYGRAREGELLLSALDSFAAELRRRGLELTVRLIVGDPAEVIIRIAGEVDAAGIILGPDPDSSLKKLFHGSVTEAVGKAFPGKAIRAKAPDEED